MFTNKLEMATKAQTVDMVDMATNSEFLGRDRELKEVHAILSSGDEQKHQAPQEGTAPRACVVHGPAGMGKSQIALEYTHRYMSEYNEVFWLPADQDLHIDAHIRSDC